MKKVFLILMIIVLSCNSGSNSIPANFSSEISQIKQDYITKYKPESFLIEAEGDLIEIELLNSDIAPVSPKEIEKLGLDISLRVYDVLINKGDYSRIYFWYRNKKGITNPNILASMYISFTPEQLEIEMNKRGIKRKGNTLFSIEDFEIKLIPYSKKKAGVFWNICIQNPKMPRNCYGSISFNIYYADNTNTEYVQELPQFGKGCNDYNLMSFMVKGSGNPQKEIFKLKDSKAQDIRYIEVRVMTCLNDSVPLFLKKIIPLDA